MSEYLPVLSLVLAAAFPALRAAPTIRRAERHHIVTRIPPGTPPEGDYYTLIYCRIY